MAAVVTVLLSLCDYLTGSPAVSCHCQAGRKLLAGSPVTDTLSGSAVTATLVRQRLLTAQKQTRSSSRGRSLDLPRSSSRHPRSPHPTRQAASRPLQPCSRSAAMPPRDTTLRRLCADSDTQIQRNCYQQPYMNGSDDESVSPSLDMKCGSRSSHAIRNSRLVLINWCRMLRRVVSGMCTSPTDCSRLSDLWAAHGDRETL